jgi:rhodanese-related sulfurtransferase
MINLDNILTKSGINSKELIELLDARQRGEIDFLLVDVREPFEYEMEHIKGVDMLKPTSSFQNWANEFLKEHKDKNVIFTCRTDNRSGQVANILREYGLNAINHLGGILDYNGETI